MAAPLLGVVRAAQEDSELAMANRSDYSARGGNAMTVSNSSADESIKLLSLFLLSMQDYERITKALRVSEGLLRFDNTTESLSDALAALESDSAAIDVRLMLQRKYFQDSEHLQLKKLIKLASRNGVINECDAERFSNSMRSIHDKPIEISLFDGTLVTTQFKNAEDAAYGTLLHCQLDKAQRLLGRPPEMTLLSLAPYIIEREQLLYEFRDVLVDAGVEVLRAKSKQRAAVLRQSNSTQSDLGITGSPFWSNVIGRDADVTDMIKIIESNSLDDNNVLRIASRFLELLRSDPLDTKSLRKLVWKRNWLAWGDFSNASNFIRGLPNFGINSHVSHEGGDNYAQVRLLPNVVEPWLTETPQLLSDGGCLICFTKRRNTWKVNGLVVNRMER